MAYGAASVQGGVQFSTPSGVPTVYSEDGIGFSVELRRYLAIVWKWLWLLVLGTVVAGSVAYVISRRQTPMYETAANIYVSQSSAASGSPTVNILGSQELAIAYTQLVGSADVIAHVENNLGISLVESETSIAANSSRGSQIITILVRSPDPALAATVANETAKVFAEVVRGQEMGDALAFEQELKDSLAQVQEGIAERQREVLRLSGRPADLSEEQRLQALSAAQFELDSLRDYGRNVQLRLFDLRSQINRGLTNIRTLNPAPVPAEPFSPQVLRDTLLGALLGLMVMSGVVVLREYLDDTLKSPEAVSSAVPEVGTLGAVSRFAAPSRKEKKDKTAARLPVVRQPRSAVAEAYRMVRTNLEFAQSSGARPRTMLVTSSSPREGKSTTASNLAAVLAQTGKRVILVDADLRRPTLHEIFGMPNNSGLSTLFVMEGNGIGGLLRQTDVEGLRILTSGPPPPNPAELLASRRMGEILDLLTQEAEIVIVDSPPLLGVTDASILAARLDGTVLVVDSSRTRAGALKHSVELLRRGNATIWGVILNKLRVYEGSQYYYYASYRSYADEPTKGRGKNRTPTSTNGTSSATGLNGTKELPGVMAGRE
jgi:capsular exopolysaccharide synthesis family protein